MASHAETCHGIFEVGVFRILLFPVLIEIGYLSRHTRIENECQRIHGAIRRRIHEVHLIVFAEAHTNTIHATVEAARLVGKHAKAILRVWGIGAALAIRRHADGSQQQPAYCLSHITHALITACKIIE